MAIEPISAAGGQEAVPQETQIQQLKAEQQAQNTEQQPQQQAMPVANEAAVGADGSLSLEVQMNGMGLGQNEIELHVACAEGKLDDVRAILSRGLEGLESLDVNTGCTPIVLAIRGNHHDVVRELLSAGAIIPPPGLTNDPLMLSILYPQPLYGMPPQFMNMPPQEFYAQPPFYPGQPDGRFMPPPPAGPAGPRKDGGALGSPNGNHHNLPPAEVSKTIPCRNFPNCKYGASCVFFHPGPRQFYPSGGPASGPNGSFVPQGYEGGYSGPYPPPGPYFVPQNGNGQYPNTAFAEQVQTSVNPASEIPEQQQQHDQTQTAPVPVPVPASVPSQHVPSAIAPVFVPGFQAIPGPADIMTSPPPPSQFGLSPLSPSMLGTSLPSIPPAEAFFAAASPPNGFVPPPPTVGAHQAPAHAHAHARRQSQGQNFGQQQFGASGKPFGHGHGKKPSFSGGPKPWMGRQGAQNGAAKLGGWKDGNPPPCAFYAQGNCRNGEFCKFPHIDAEGNDCRNPDVIRGVIPPVPSLARQSRNMRMMNGGFAPFDPSFRQQQHQQQMQFLQHQRMAAAQAQQGIPAGNTAAPAAATATEVESSAPTGSEDAAAAPAVAADNEAAPAKTEEAASEAPAAADAQTEKETSADAAQQTPAALPAKPVAAPMPNIIRSASQPGAQRVHANGANSRSHSPAPSNVSFHGNGHPRRAGARVPHMNGNIPSRAASAGGAGPEKKISSTAASQRVPRADEFPALGTPTSEKKEPQWNAGKTAAQVLLAPAPPKPEVKVTSADEGSASDKSDKESVTMDSDSESDAVIISTKPSSAAVSGTATPAVPAAAAAAPEPKRAPISFASAVSAASIPSLESPPVALKA
ncbi:hypothetical protein IAU59_003837 [Kwoniella sp. CBS 9459]